MSRFLILGSRGMLGHAASRFLVSRGHEVVSLGRGEFDIARDPMSKLEALARGADALLNAAGVIKPRIAETPVEDVLRVNSVFPHDLARLARRLDKPCFHITTDCVYSGDRGSYSEADFLDCDDVYGLSKAGGDTRDCMTLRTSIIGEERGQSRSLLEWARSQAGGPVNGFVDHRWNGVTTVYLAEIVANILATDRYREGVFHVYSPSPVTKHELVSLIDEVYGLGLEITAVRAPKPCDRTLTSLYSLSGELVTKPIRQQLEEMRSFFRAVN